MDDIWGGGTREVASPIAVRGSFSLQKTDDCPWRDTRTHALSIGVEPMPLPARWRIPVSDRGTRKRFCLDAVKLHQKSGLTFIHTDQTGTLQYANLAIVGA